MAILGNQMRRAGVGMMAGALCASAALAQECQLDAASSVDATGGTLTYHSDTSYTQALLVSNHAYQDGSTIVVLAATICDDGATDRCFGLAVEGFGPGEVPSFWTTEILRTAETVTVNTNGYSDLERTRPMPESQYTDVFRVRRCTD
jgi:hypothetical protein